jgi:hypothetical protein
MPDPGLGQACDQGIDIVWAIAIAVRPVFQIEVDAQALRVRPIEGCPDVGDMRLGRLAKLTTTVSLAALGQQVQHLASGAPDPIHACPAIGEPQHLDPLNQAAFPGPVDDLGHGAGLARGHARRGDLDPIDPHLFEQDLGKVELLGG